MLSKLLTGITVGQRLDGGPHRLVVLLADVLVKQTLCTTTRGPAITLYHHTETANISGFRIEGEREGGRANKNLTDIHRERERERETDRQTDRQRERDRQRQTERQTDRHRQTDRQTDRQRERDRQRQTERQRVKPKTPPGGPPKKER